MSMFVEGIISTQVKNLLQSTDGYKIEIAKSGFDHSVTADRFSLQVPYCQEYLKWYVIFNARTPTICPDVILEAGQGDKIEWENLKSVKEWNAHNPKSLLELITELKSAFTFWQTKDLMTNLPKRIAFEIETMQSHAYEVLTIKGNEKKIRCLIQVQHSFDGPTRSSNNNNKNNNNNNNNQHIMSLFEDSPMFRLILEYFIDDPTKAPIIRLLPPSQSQFDVIKIPTWESSTCFANYILIIQESLRQQVELWRSTLMKREEIFGLFVEYFGHPLEFDSKKFLTATFLLQAQHPDLTLPIILHVTLPDSVNGNVVISFQSPQFTFVYPSLCSTFISNFNLNPNQTPLQVASLIRNFVFDKEKEFFRNAQGDILK